MSATVQDAKSDHPLSDRERRGSGLSSETWKSCGVYVESDHRTIARMLAWKSAKKLGDVLAYPHFNPDGTPSGDVFQVKPSHPLEPARKYETPKGRRNRAYFPPLPGCVEAIQTPGRLLNITEGVKKSLAACQDGIPTIGLAGVENWSGPRKKDEQGRAAGDRELCDDLLAINWKDRPVTITFDTDPRINPNVNRAACSLAVALERHGAKVSIVRFPVEYDVEQQAFRKYGIDDWILAKGAGSFRSYIDQAIRPPAPNGIEQHRDEMRQRRETIRSAPGIFLDRSGTGSGKSYADAIEIPFYKRSLTVVPRHEIAWEVLESDRKAGIDAAVYPELSTCEKNCKGEKCWRFKYGPAACVKGCCENYEEVNIALGMGFSASETVCLKCGFNKDCEYKRRLTAIESSRHLIATNSRLSLSFGSIASSADFVTIHESVFFTLRPAIEIKGTPKTVTALEAIRDVARRMPDVDLFTDDEKRFFSWVLRGVVDAFLEVFATPPANVQGGVLDVGQEFAPVPAGGSYSLFSLLRAAGLPSDCGDVLKLCIYATIGALADCAVKVTEIKQKDGVQRFVSIVGIVNVTLPSDAVVLLNDASADLETIRSATGLDIADITPPAPVESQQRIVQVPVDVTQQTKPDRVLGLLRSLMLQHFDREKIGIITHRKHLNHIEKCLTETERARIAKVDYFRGLASRGSNDWMQCDLLLIIGTPRVPQEVIETALIQSGHPEAISRVLKLDKPNWGPDYWLGRREDGRAVTVRCLSYCDHHWQQAYRSIVAEELRQCVGRARAVCSDGVADTVVVSTENLGYPLSDENPQKISGAFLDDAASIISLFFNELTGSKTRQKRWKL